MRSKSVASPFTKGEAEALVGKTFENIVTLPDVPQGARGLVIAAGHQKQKLTGRHPMGAEAAPT